MVSPVATTPVLREGSVTSTEDATCFDAGGTVKVSVTAPLS
jgi:hypothetical protein